MLLDFKQVLKWGAGVLAAIMLLLAAIFAFHWIKDRFFPDKQVQMPAAHINVGLDGKLSQPNQPQVVYIQGDTQHTKEVMYVPKEVDKSTGQQEKTDVQFERKQGKIYVKVNGKEFEIPAEVKEEAKFQNGKLVVTEETEIRVNITAPKPALHLGLGWSVNGPAVQLNGPLYSNVSWWLYGDKKTAAGGVQFPIMNTSNKREVQSNVSNGDKQQPAVTVKAVEAADQGRVGQDAKGTGGNKSKVQ